MQKSLAQIGMNRLKNILIIDKQNNPGRIKELINCDVEKVLENFFELFENKINTDIIVNENGISIKIDVLAKRMKELGTLPDVY